jgi:hypothetical protein
LQLIFQVENSLKDEDVVRSDDSIEEQMFKGMDKVEDDLNQDGRTNPVLNESQPIVVPRRQSDQDALSGSQGAEPQVDPKQFSISFVNQVLKSKSLVSL